MGYIFRGKIKCVYCQNNFRGKNERSKNVYVCGGYSRDSSLCSRYVLHETDILEIVERHLELKGERLMGNVLDHVRLIEVNPNVGYKILYNDGTDSLISTDNSYGSKYRM